MKTVDMLSLALRMFKTRTMRTILTILGVSIGIAAVHFLVSLGYGLQSAVLDRIASADALLSLDVSPGPTTALDDELIDEIYQFSTVTEVSRMKRVPAQVIVGDIAADSTLLLVDESYPRFEGVDIVMGEPLNDESGGVLLSSAGAQLLGASTGSVVGMKLSVNAFVVQASTGSTTLFPIQYSGSFIVTGLIDNLNESLLCSTTFSFFSSCYPKEHLLQL
jgi:ABC-type antimicrobial peptide transport system permease subunit